MGSYCTSVIPRYEPNLKGPEGVKWELGFAYLKGLHHDDFAILGQFCVKIITKCLYLYTKCSCKTMRKISHEFYQGELTIIILGVIFENIASKLEKIGPIFSSFNPFSSMPSAATDGRKQFQSNKIVFNNNDRPLFLEFN